MAAIKREGLRTGEFLLSDMGSISFDELELEPGATLPPGQLLGRVTTTKRYAPYDKTATDGREKAAGVLLSRAEAATSPRRKTCVTRLAEVSAKRLVGVDDDAKASLALVNIIIR